MMRLIKVFLDVDGRIIEARLGFRLSQPEGREKILPLPDQPQSLAATSRGRFKQDRESDFLRFLL